MVCLAILLPSNPEGEAGFRSEVRQVCSFVQQDGRYSKVDSIALVRPGLRVKDASALGTFVAVEEVGGTGREMSRMRSCLLLSQSLLPS